MTDDRCQRIADRAITLGICAAIVEVNRLLNRHGKTECADLILDNLDALIERAEANHREREVAC